MALTICLRCDRTYSQQKERCPHCEAHNPGTLATAMQIAAEFKKPIPIIEQSSPRMPLTFWNGYLGCLQMLWTSPWWYMFLFSVFSIGLGGHINYPCAVIPGFLFLGLVFFPLLGYLFFVVDNNHREREQRS